MALPKGESMVLHLSSDDPTAVGSASNFKITLAKTINLPGQWMCALQSAEFYNPGGSSVYVSTSINQLVTTGSELTNTLHIIQRAEFPGPYFWQEISTLPVWVPIATSAAHDIEIALSDDNGDYLAVDDVTVTRLTLLLRQVS